MSDVLDSIPTESLQFNDAPSLVWVRVSDARGLIWSENPKLHDLGSLVQSFQRHGFQEIPKFDKLLPNISGGMGAIKAGNGRIETLARMEHDKMQPPRGIAVEKESGAWVMPLLVGTDAESTSLARSYAVDSNNLTMAGGDFTLYDYSRLWDYDAYTTLLESLAKNDNLPVSVDRDDLDTLLRLRSISRPDLDNLAEEFGEPNEEDFWPIIKVKVSPEIKSKFNQLMDAAPGEKESDKFAHLLGLIQEP